MNKQLSMAVAGAVLAFSASANAGIVIPAGDWTVDIGGNVNAFYSNTNNTGVLKNNTVGAYGSQTTNSISTGLLPSAFGVGAKTRQNDLDIAFQFTFFVGSDSGSGAAFGGNSLNIRQGFLTFGDKSWGTIKLGRDLGIFASDAILSDMTLLGVGAGAGNPGSSTLGRIGSGYQYADWKGQISYVSPNWNGLGFAAGITEGYSNSTDLTQHDLGYEGKVTYDFTADDLTGRVWTSGIVEGHQGSATTPSFTTWGADIGVKAAYAGFGVVGYYYGGEGLSNQGAARVGGYAGGLNGGIGFLATNQSDDQGGYVQGTYTIPGIGTKLGASWGTSRSQAKNSSVEFENESWILGAYHPLTKNLNLVAEYTNNDLSNVGGVQNADGSARTISLGAIMFF